MSAHCFASQWPVNAGYLGHLRQLYDLVLSFGGEYRIMPDIHYHEEKPFIDTLLVNIDTAQSAGLLAEMERIGFADWEETDAEAWGDEQTFDPYQMRAFGQRTWEARIHMAHRHNALLKQGDTLSP
jgi:hypothetical protein